jgi:hypothetical protein
VTDPGTGQQQQGQQQQGQQQNTWTPPASQEEFDRIVQDRVARAERKYRDYDSFKEKAEQFDILSAASASEKDKAVEDARKQALVEAANNYQPRVVRAEFKLVAKDVGLSKEQLDSLLEDLDLSKYADDDGEPDTAKIEKKVKAFAPQKEEDGKGQQGNGRGPNFGQGSGHHQSKLRKGEAGLAEAKRRFPDAFKASAS